MKNIIIAIDGYSACGKGTLAKFLANNLGYKFIDTGAMYRAVTWYFMTHHIDIEIDESVSNALSKIHLDFSTEKGFMQPEITVNGQNKEHEIRSLEIASKVSQVSAISAVRTFLVAQQQQIGKNKGIVMDGRDIGTVVFPDAELKIFMTASPQVRAKRRFDEMVKAGKDVDYDIIFENLAARDHIDSTREDSPLKPAEDAKVLDNSFMSIPEQNEIALKWAMEKINIEH